jgi:hypothetical protein
VPWRIVAQSRAERTGLRRAAAGDGQHLSSTLRIFRLDQA